MAMTRRAPAASKRPGQSARSGTDLDGRARWQARRPLRAMRPVRLRSSRKCCPRPRRAARARAGRSPRAAAAARRRSGSRSKGGVADVDDRGAPEIAQIPAGKLVQPGVEKVPRHLIARGHGIGRQLAIANHEHADTGLDFDGWAHLADGQGAPRSLNGAGRSATRVCPEIDGIGRHEGATHAVHVGADLRRARSASIFFMAASRSALAGWTAR